ncbi:MAG: glutamate formimidoyltransferase [Oligoflexia bacterium]|nr:glutamate formimidoyltransferase [Oligoflexia bacterium]
MKLIECVPNISEGRDRSIIDQIVAAASIDGVKILDVDPGKATNRTVITIVGGPDQIVESAFNLIKSASELIDMRKHKGAHPRMGATDVCPFIPVQDTSMQECVELAKRLGDRVGRELGIPVYLYEAAATSVERRSLAWIREGEYEGFSEKIRRADMKPDFGPLLFNQKSGATVIGARPFLVAYNINLNTRDTKLANQIAKRIRESGYKQKNAEGKSVAVPGMFQHCRAVGWFIEEYGIAQVSINFTDFTKTAVHTVFDAAVKLAEELGLRVTGSELVGLIPKAALISAGEHYLSKQGKTAAVPEKQLLECAVRSLGLGDVTPFKLEEKVIEYKLAANSGLIDLKVRDFLDRVAEDSAVPGGGSVAALAGAAAASLCAMVSNLSFSKTTDLSAKQRFELLGKQSLELNALLQRGVDEDSACFTAVLAAVRLPKGSDVERQQRSAALFAAYKQATEVPLAAARNALGIFKIAAELVSSCLQSARSDVETAMACAYAAVFGGLANVRINFESLCELNSAGDPSMSEIQAQASVLRAEAAELADKYLRLQ